MNANSTNIIHLQWSGPFSWAEKDKLNQNKDYGIYQVYGCHSIYGVDVLLYIGKASKQTFAVRLKQHWEYPAHQDFERVSIYVGRCSGWNGTPSNDIWEEQIDLAEKLLILSAMPAYNAQKRIDINDPRLRGLHVLNWGCYRSLLPEASGRRYSSEFYDETNYKPFGAE